MKNIKNYKLFLEELTENYTIVNCSEEDFDDMCIYLQKTFDMLSIEETKEYIGSSVNFNISFKAIDKDNNLIGAILLGDKQIKETMEENKLVEEIESIDTFDNLNGVEIVALLVEPEFRGKGLGKELISKAKETIKSYDYSWLLVYKSLKTHDMWKNNGYKATLIVNDDVEDMIVYSLINQ